MVTAHYTKGPDGTWNKALDEASSSIKCKICDYGTMVRKSTYRMSGPVVAIGYLLLIPSICGMIFCALAFLGFAGDSGSGTGAVIGFVILGAIGLSSFIGGLLGWLLVMKKRVLQCSSCGATVNAS